MEVKAMKKTLLLLLCANLLCNPVWADSDAVPLSKGSPAPWDGVLLSPDRASSARKAEQELPQYKLLSESLQNSLNLSTDKNNFLKEKVTILTTDNQMLATSLQQQRTANEFTKVLWFVIGVGVTALAIEGASKLR